jgi:hypothetical protein
MNVKRFDADQLNRFKQYTESDMTATAGEIKSATDDAAFNAAFAKMNTLKAQAALIQHNIDATADQEGEESGAETQTPAQKRAATLAAKQQAAASANT